MSAKRPSLKGKGAQIFLGGEDDTQDESSASQKNVSEVAGKVKARKSTRENELGAERAQDIAEPPKAVIVEANKDGSQEKVEKDKATFYLPLDVLEDLEELWHDVRRLTHKKIKKSEIVSIALQHASDEFRAWQNEERKRSKLMDRLSK